MGKRAATLLCLVLVIYTSLFVHAHGIRHTQPLKIQSARHHNSPKSSFAGCMPKASPIPPSGPSKRHNNIGTLSSHRQP
ncbi:hypothetical protein NMG60_11032904 [Bertholletia excelsa]